MWKTADRRGNICMKGRSAWSGLFAIWLLFFCAQPVYAGDPFVACVQGQLAMLGHDPGPKDGRLGPRTRSALASLVARTKSLRTLPPLTPRHAVTWCREIERAYPATRPQTPSSLGNIITADNDTQNRLLREVLRDVQTWYTRRLGVDLVSRAVVVASADPGTALDRMQEAQRLLGVRVSARWYLAGRCGATRDHVAFATKNVIVVCLKPAKQFDADWARAERRHLTYLVAHEFFHIVQAELAADKLPQTYRFGTRPPAPRTRPSWLVEGSADHYALRYMAELSGKAFTLDKVFAAAAPHADRSLQAISAQTYLTRVSDYATSALAASLLAQHAGVGAHVDYWRGIGRGLDHDAAFAAAYGLSRKAFEEDFQTLRRTLEIAKAF